MVEVGGVEGKEEGEDVEEGEGVEAGEEEGEEGVEVSLLPVPLALLLLAPVVLSLLTAASPSPDPSLLLWLLPLLWLLLWLPLWLLPLLWLLLWLLLWSLLLALPSTCIWIKERATVIRSWALQSLGARDIVSSLWMKLL